MKNKSGNIKEAYRVIANAYAQYEALGELKSALQYLVDADKYLEDKEAELKSMDDKVDLITDQLKSLDKNYSNLDAQYKDKTNTLEADFSVLFKGLEDKKKFETDRFTAFLNKNQETINRAKEEQKKLENQFKNNKELMNLEIKKIMNERNKQEEALQNVKSKLQAVLGGINDG